MNPHFLLLDKAWRELESLDHRFVFVGGATVSLHIDDPAGGPVRATDDVDLVVEVAGYAEFAQIEMQLRNIGFEQDLLDDDSPICRWKKDNLLIDVMPTKPELIGFSSSQWFRAGFKHARSYALPTGTTVEAFGPLYLMAAKIEAFEDRGDNDWLASQDIEDLATILDARKQVFEELATDDEAAVFVRTWLTQCGDKLTDRLAGHVGGYERSAYLVERLSSLSDEPTS